MLMNRNKGADHIQWTEIMNNEALIKSSLGKNVNCVNTRFGSFLLDCLAIRTCNQHLKVYFFLSFCNHTKARICTLNGKQVLDNTTIVKARCFVSKIKMYKSKGYQLLPTPKLCLGKTHLSIRNQSLHNEFWIKYVRDQLMINIQSVEFVTFGHCNIPNYKQLHL